MSKPVPVVAAVSSGLTWRASYPPSSAESRTPCSAGDGDSTPPVHALAKTLSAFFANHGNYRTTSPQQLTVPSILTPQACVSLRASCRNAPEGGVDIP